MRLFHRTNTEATTAILRDGFKDRAEPTETNLGFYDQTPEIKAVWFADRPLDGDYPPGVRPSTTKSATYSRITATNRQERCISGVKLLPSPQLIKWLVG